ncbi:transglycosylase SLT domain-containing protein [Ferruginivarius sediminum]|uniref:Lytic transglycosylase domain-containing protein n=1 Tax=Ferruginivarius sediminum TaxID=2661937 RepID=A0A369T4Q0_9PROT|nr:transglycosylase SLT domain-containing protein [Ferruginivarius sediminum]RDD60321.1 lytic transglycosylase domain-containing protein [Ferruginivarius sediminum]
MLQRRRFAPAPILLLAVLAALAAPRPALSNGGAWAVCARATAAAEELRSDLPAHLLSAVAAVESGRWHKGRQATIAWPWTVTAEGEGRFLPSKAAAIEAVERLQARGIANIDVGCMQVNLHYHGDAFESLSSAFDPAANVAYAAEFLLDLRRERGSWTRAIGDYHSQTPRYSGPYRLKVFRAWRKAKKAAYAEQRRERQAKALFAQDLSGYLRDDRLL